MATKYVDFELGNDFPDLLTDVVFTDNSGGVLGTKTAHGLITGDVRITFNLQSNNAHYSNDIWTITKVTNDTFTLDGAVWSSFSWYDQTGDMCSVGGTTWATAWKTITGATSQRIAPGDSILIAKTDDPAALGLDLHWTRNLGFIKTGLKVGRFNERWLAYRAGVTGSTQTYYGFFDSADAEAQVNMSPASEFTTGPAIVHNLAATLNLSSYTHLTIWTHGSTNYVAGDFSVILYDAQFGVVLSNIGFSQDGADGVQGCSPAHPLVTSDQVVISGCTQAYANAKWTITKKDANYFSLDGASWAAFTGADNYGNVRVENTIPTVLDTLTSIEGINVATTLQEFRFALTTPASLTAVKAIGIQLNTDRGASVLSFSSCYAYNKVSGILEVSRMDDLARTAEWTAATNITLSNVAATQAIMRGIRMTPGTSFGTGIMAYKDYGVGQNWSSYKYVSCLLAGNLPSTTVVQLLIDDTVACASPLETISAPYWGATATWVTFRIATPANLTAVRSIGFSVTVDPGTSYLDCFAIFLSTGYTGDSLLTNSSKLDWYSTNLFACSNWWSHGRSGNSVGQIVLGKDTATQAGYYRKPFLLQAGTTSVNIVSESGTAGNMITFSGGWNRADTTQDGETWVDGGSGPCAMLVCDNKSYIAVEGIAFVRGDTYSNLGTSSYPLSYCTFDIPYVGYHLASSFGLRFGSGSVEQTITIGTIQCSSVQVGYGAFQRGAKCSITVNRIVEMYNSGNGLAISGVDLNVEVGTVLGWNSASNYPIYISNAFGTKVNVTGDVKAGPASAGPFLYIGASKFVYVKLDGDLFMRDSGASYSGGIQFMQTSDSVVTFTKVGAVISRAAIGVTCDGNYGGKNMVANVICQNCTADVYIGGLSQNELIMQYCGLDDTKFTFSIYGIGQSSLQCHHFNQSIGDHRTYYGGFTSGTAGAKAVRNTADADDGDCIKATFTSNMNGTCSILIPVGWISLTGGVSNTVSVKMKKDSSYNGRVPMLAVEGEGLVKAFTRSVTALTTSYQTYSLVFTPARTQFAKLLIQADGTAGSLFIDTIGVS